MKDDKELITIQGRTPLVELIKKLQSETNPVTKSVYKDIILDRLHRNMLD